MKRLTVEQAVEYVFGSPKVGKEKTTVNGIADLFDALAQSSLYGTARIYGIRGNPDGFSRSRWRHVRIPKAMWETHEIDLIAYMRDGSGDCVPTLDKRRKPVFVDLTFRRRDLWLIMGWKRIAEYISRWRKPKTHARQPERKVKPEAVNLAGSWGKPDVGGGFEIKKDGNK